MRTFYLAIGMAVCLAAATYCIRPSDLLPADNAVSGWVKSSVTTVCEQGTVTDSTSLYAVIDGGDEVFIVNGMRAAVFQPYVDGNGDNICVWIFNQPNLDSVLSLFNTFKGGEYRFYHGLGDTARLDTSLLDAYQLEMGVVSFYVRVIESQSNDDTLVKVGVALARAIARNAVAVERDALPGCIRGPVLNSFPDPANRGCWFELAAGEHAYPAFPECCIYDCSGSLISKMTLMGNGAAGYRAYWNGAALSGRKTVAGRYMAVVQNGRARVTKQFILGD
jgi:hypothetical protein